LACGSKGVSVVEGVGAVALAGAAKVQGRCRPLATHTGQPPRRAGWPLSRVEPTPTISRRYRQQALPVFGGKRNTVYVVSITTSSRTRTWPFNRRDVRRSLPPPPRRYTALSGGAKPLGDFPCTVSRWTSLGGCRPVLDSQAADAAKLAGIVGHEGGIFRQCVARDTSSMPSRLDFDRPLFGVDHEPSL